jgi:hypothetical protein
MAVTQTLPYIVTLQLPKRLDESFLDLVPEQRYQLDRLMITGRVVSYFLSIEMASMWIICRPIEEKALLEMLASLPLCSKMRSSYCPLTMYQATIPVNEHAFSLS